MDFYKCVHEAFKYPKAKLAVLEIFLSVAAIWIIPAIIKTTFTTSFVCVIAMFTINHGVQEYGKCYFAVRREYESQQGK